jgi:hypothetical protein
MSTNETVPGTFVMGHGSVRGAMAFSVGGVVGSLAHSAVTARSIDGLLPRGQIGYLAAHHDRLELRRVKRGAFKPTATDEVLAYAARDQLADVQLVNKALSGTIQIQFRDGDSWLFDVPVVHRRSARAVVDALGF